MIKLLTRLSSLVAASLAFLPVAAHAESQIVARLDPTVTPGKIGKRYGLILRDYTANAPFALFAAADDAAADKAIQAMSLDPLVIWAEGNEAVGAPEGEAKSTPMKGGSLPAVGDRSKLQQINANLLGQIDWSPSLAATPGRAVRLAILDTGLSPRQPELWAKVDASVNFVEPNKPAYDQPRKVDTNGNGIRDEGVGHGTMIAGIVDQIAPQVRLVVARVADSDGMATGWTLIKGLAFAVAAKAEIANVSLGSTIRIDALSDVLDWCEQNRLLVVAAAGNGSQKRATYPARINKVICVSGLDMDNRKASFSNWDGTCDAAAPAVGFASQFWDGELAVWSGTSFAAPVVAASLADCLRRTNPLLPGTLRKACTSSGVSVDAWNPAYKGSLGTLIDFTRLDRALRKP